MRRLFYNFSFHRRFIGCVALCASLHCAVLAQSTTISWSAFGGGGEVSKSTSSGELRSLIDQTFSAASSREGSIQVATGFLQGTKSGGTNDVKTSGSNLPQTYVLEQNYPNPFNPTTTIRYALPLRSHVTLIVYNVLGQQVAELVNGEIEAGYHEAKLDGTGLASGVYFYQLKAGDFAQTKRLVLLK